MRALTVGMLMTWGAASAQFLTIPADAIAPDDASIERGHDLAKIIAAASKLPEKTEFETIQSFQQRTDPMVDSVVYGTVKISSLLSVKVAATSDSTAGSVYYKYDAEKGMVRVCFPFAFGNNLYGFKDTALGRNLQTFGLPVWKNSRKSGTYTGQNALGVKVRVTRWTVARADLQMPLASYPSECSESTPLPNSEAARVLPDASIVLLGRLVAPYTAFEESRTEPTLNSPDEIRELQQMALFAPAQVLIVGKGRIIYRGIPPIARQ